MEYTARYSNTYPTTLDPGVILCQHYVYRPDTRSILLSPFPIIIL